MHLERGSETMRLLGTFLMIVGAICLVAAALAQFGPTLRANGVMVGGVVTSISGAVLGGILMLVIGAALRRRSALRRTPNSSER